MILFYKRDVVNQFSNNLIESFTMTEINSEIPDKIALLQTALEQIESRIPYFSGVTISQSTKSDLTQTDIGVRGTELNNIKLDFTVKPSPTGSPGDIGINGEIGKIGEIGETGKQGLTGYWFS